MTPHARKDSRRNVSQSPNARFSLESLEHRLLMAVDNRAPSVDAVYVTGTVWADEFLAYLEEGNDGSSQYGYAVPASGGGTRSILPWVNLNRFSIQFSEDVSVQQNDLEIASAAGKTYTVTAFAYDPATFTATWTLDQQVTDADVLTLTLDATSPTGVTDPAGNPLRGAGNGGDFVQQLRILPGDTDRSGEVLENDYLEVSEKFFSSVTDERAATGPLFSKYTIFHDVDGSGVILAEDHAETRQRVGTTLPA